MCRSMALCVYVTVCVYVCLCGTYICNVCVSPAFKSMLYVCEFSVSVVCACMQVYILVCV